MKAFLPVLFLLSLVLVTATCKKETTEPLYDLTTSANYVFLKSIQKSNEANELRSATYSAPFEISKVEREKDNLSVTVTFPDGCGDTGFEIIWNGLVMESYPEMIILYLRRPSGCTLPGNATSRNLVVNLTDKLGDALLAQRVKIILCNASKKANSENSDISVPGN